MYDYHQNNSTSTTCNYDMLQVFHYVFSRYCKFGNFRVTFISRIFYFRIISDFLNSRVSVHVFYKVYCDSLLTRTLNSRGNQFANISEN